jgi:hypothetical protein
METKFPPAGKTTKSIGDVVAEMVARGDGDAFAHEPVGQMPEGEVRDLVRNAMRKIDVVYEDAAALTPTEFDAFKLAAGVAFQTMKRFDSMAEEIFGGIFGNADSLRRSHMLADIMHVMTQPAETLGTKHRLIRLMLSLYLSAHYTDKIDHDTAKAMLEKLRKGWKD